MGGVGSFNRQNRTLYIGRIKETGPGPETEEIVLRHFKEWGEIEKSKLCLHDKDRLAYPPTQVRVLQYRSVAFVSYKSELHAQFAKEAMACQSLDNDEILNVRWATEDPNPVSKEQEKRRLEEQGQEAITARMDPRIVDAMRAVRALEEGAILDDQGQVVESVEDGGEGGEVGHMAKRRRIEALAEEPLMPPSLLSADTLEGLKYLAEIRQPTSMQPSRGGVLGLAEYGSDEED